jgi:predicted GNAT family acetyltransferase
MTDQVEDHPAENRFTLSVNGHPAVVQYRREADVITFLHTEVPPALSGQGIGSRLIRGALDLVRQQGLRVVARCPFVASYLSKHPEYSDLLQTKAQAARSEKQHLDALLDEGLKQTFPASDPPAVVDPTR